MEQLRDDSDQEEEDGSSQQLSQLPPSSLLPGIMAQQQQQAVPTATASLQQQHDVALKATVSLGSNGNCLGVSTVSAVSPEPQTQDEPGEVVILREKATVEGQQDKQAGDNNEGSKRNSLDSKTVQGLAQDLAAECAKAYALME